MNINTCVINGKIYKFQHPGNRAWLQLQSAMLDINTKTINMEKLIDYCFEHVVLPVSGARLDLDTIPISELEAWQIVLPRFLRGELVAGYVYPDDKKSTREGEKLLQEFSKK